MTINSGLENDSVFIKLLDKEKQPLYLNMEVRYTPEGVLKLSIYSKYWMLNKSGLKLYYRPVGDFGKGRLSAGQSKKKKLKIN